MQEENTPERNVPWFRKLHWQILVAMALGILAGRIGGTEIVPYVGWLGTLFVRLLRMIIVPLVLTSIITGVASVGGGRSLGRLFGKTLGYYVATSALAALTGLLLVNLIQPGASADLVSAEKRDLPELESAGSPIELLLDIVPQNVIDAAAKADMLGVIFFCIAFGIAITGLPDVHRKPLTTFFDAAFHAMMRLTGGIIMVAPLGVFGLITRVVGETGFDSFRALGLYMVTIASGLTIHMFVTLPLMLLLVGRMRPSVHFRNMTEPLAMAFSTSSSGATLPVTLSAVEKKVRVPNKVSSFVLPMGATVNMDGTALYECAGVLFIAQALGQSLSLEQQIIVVVTALLASIGAAAVPSAGLVIIFLVLEAVDLRGPEVDVIVGMMLAIDRPLDMFRTAVNVFSDSCGAAIIAKSEGHDEVNAQVVGDDDVFLEND
ncbi:MAG: dicarboxylate/amino acid:cation symporter [Thermoanaerobaculia bacterium]|nr:dicarboxylate/amino acid:cation symporter [Thermoanaerobaculia bacterium]